MSDLLTVAHNTDLLRELEPVVARELDRHLATAREWFPHQYIPWDLATTFEGPLNGTSWHPDQSPLDPSVRDALLINLLTEDNLPSYHYAIASHFGRDSAWGTWVHRWTAEEGRHSIALRDYLHVMRAVDPVELERGRMANLSTGWEIEQPTPAHVLAYVTIQELATREAHHNVGQAIGDPNGTRLMRAIATDENLHMLFYRTLCTAALDLSPDLMTRAFADVIDTFRLPGHGMPAFRTQPARFVLSGLYDVAVHHDRVLVPLLRALRLMERGNLGPEGEAARDRIGLLLEALAGKKQRLVELRERVARFPAVTGCACEAVRRRTP
ncbi:acyl-ACP desaturase [Kitasatospora viridis]|uniref:Acyl-[acyl-carrier-protein] desaturase n=1 Tax=Kitasatospora viridis TaxID=281105 RepID=A0A561TW18_9ACTN|nr:acyl-ACP desaturase [Kitasatospora viridis]TWF91305.1 acyl-[acyl-carrier-protein] desaturase [Kitasatospora viridis]